MIIDVKYKIAVIISILIHGAVMYRHK